MGYHAVPMSRKSFSNGNWRKDSAFKRLCRAMLSCKTEEEMANFLRDIATLSELKALSERLEVAGQIQEGIPYRLISEATGASTATVTRVSSFLRGEYKGYKTILGRLHHHSASRAGRPVSMQ